uniref:Uncharacterized protein n=1 Tax=Lepeophtheirus salmonis TaxID=72036 RepID=A0A0K2SW23_LEPSM
MNDHQVFHETVRKHLREYLKCLPQKLKLKLTKIQKEEPLKFSKERSHWGISVCL